MVGGINAAAGEIKPECSGDLAVEGQLRGDRIVAREQVFRLPCRDFRGGTDERRLCRAEHREEFHEVGGARSGLVLINKGIVTAGLPAEPVGFFLHHAHQLLQHRLIVCKVGALAKDNRTIGRFHLDGIPPAPRGVPQVEVTFDIDANGILHVSAKDKGTGKEQKIRIEASSGLTDAEIQKMKDEAQANAETDKKEKEKIEKVNQADSLIFQTEKQLKEYGDKLSDNNKSAINSALEKLREAHKSLDLTAIDTAMNALNTAWQAASQEMYASGANAGAQGGGGTNAGGPGAGQAEGGAAPGSGDATDVEYEEVKK